MVAAAGCDVGMDIISKQDCEALLDFIREIAAPGIALPSLDELQTMVACSFWASLETEEGRPVTFALVFGAGARSGEEDLRLADAVELSSDGIVKLAPAVLAEHTGLRVQRGPDGGLGVDGLTPLDGDALVLEAFAPGQLRFKLGARTRALLRSGDVTFLASDHSDNLLFLVNAVSEYGLEVNPEFVVVAQACERLLESMMRHGHGGTLLWVPGDCEWEDGVKSIRFACAEPYRGLHQAVSDVYRATSGDRPIESRGSRADPARRLLAEQLRSIQDEIGQGRPADRGRRSGGDRRRPARPGLRRDAARGVAARGSANERPRAGAGEPAGRRAPWSFATNRCRSWAARVIARRPSSA